MKPLLVLLVCWSSLALAVGGPYKVGGPGLPHSLQGKQTLMSELSIGHPMAPHSTLRGTNSDGYDPWAEQVTGLPAGYLVGGIHAVDSNTVWAVSFTYGYTSPDRSYIRTTNGGLTWICDTVHNAPASFSNAAICALDANRAWIAMYDFSNTLSSGGIFKTTDGGVTWQQDPTAFTTPNGFADFIHFFDANNGVAVGDPTNGYFEIYTTSNGGASWSRVPQVNIPSPRAGEAGLLSTFTAAGNSLWFPVYITTGTGWAARFYRTTDRGLTWSVHDYPGAGPGYYLQLTFQDVNVGLGNGDWGEVSRTTDGGSIWTRVSSPTNAGLADLRYVPGTPGMYVGSASGQYRGLEGGLIYGTAYTVDGGANWTMACREDGYYWLGFATASAGWRADVYGPNIYKWTMAQGRVIGTSVDTLNFVTLEARQRSDTIAVDVVNFGSDPLTVSGIVAPGANFTVVKQPSFPAILPPLGSARVEVCFTPKENAVLYDSLLFVSNASNAPRTSVYLGGRGVIVQPAKSWTMYATSASLCSLNTATGAPTTIGSLGTIKFQGLTIHPSTGILYGSMTVGSKTTLYRICCASAWTTLERTFPVGNMRAIAFDKNGELYGASMAGRLYRLNLATGDTIGIGTAPGVVYGSIAFSPSGRLWASVVPSVSGKDKIYTVNTTTGEATLVGSTGDNAPTPAIFINPDGALFGLKGYGTQTDTVISIDTLTGVGTTLFSTGTTGITSVTGSIRLPLRAVEPTAEMPKGFALLQNYPNPFNPSTEIGYRVSGVGMVTLKVYDILGREVAVLVNEKKAPGSYSVRFEASGLASGVYFYRLFTGRYVETRKMLLLR